jgi:hypothetical protein
LKALSKLTYYQENNHINAEFYELEKLNLAQAKPLIFADFLCGDITQIFLQVLIAGLLKHFYPFSAKI